MSAACPPIPAELLAMLDRMYGEDWPPKLARDTGRGAATVRQWKRKGYMPLPAQAWVRRRYGTKPTGTQRKEPGDAV